MDAGATRIEKDLLGTLELPNTAYYGVQTLRALQNFKLTGITLSHYPKLVVALAMVKHAAADANHMLGIWMRQSTKRSPMPANVLSTANTTSTLSWT